MRSVSKALRRQLALNEGKNLLHQEAASLLEIDETFLAALEEFLSPQAEALPKDTVERLASDAAEAFLVKLFALNQFIQVDNAAQVSLKQIYVTSWQHLVETKEIASTIRAYHYPKLRAFIKDLYPTVLAEGLAGAKQLGRVPSAEYSAKLQMHILRLGLQGIRDPILDIGCGAQANLVRSLRAKNLKAYGFDRVLQEKTHYLFEADWFDYDYGLNKWGTIVSNLSFANHLIYAQRYDPRGASKYLRAFSKILDSLKEGGSFTFAPAVEQLAGQIDLGRYKMEKWEISSVAKGMRVTRIAL